MKSKILSFKLIKETWNQQLWVFALACTAFILAFPVIGLQEIEKIEGYKKITMGIRREMFATYFFDFSQGFSEDIGRIGFVLAICGILAIISALAGFSYLHSQKTVDFYHSLPIRREKLFLNQLVVSTMHYLLPALVGMFLLMVVAAFKGVFSIQAFGCGMLLLVVGLFYYLICFAVSSLAMLLTGRIIVGALGTGILYFYSILLYYVLVSYAGMFLNTYSANGDSWINILLCLLCPIGWGRLICNGAAGISGWIFVLLAIPAAIALLVLCLFVYKRRDSAAAGNSMAFPKVAIFIEGFLVILGSMASGIFFSIISNNQSTGWLIFGLLLGLVVSYGVVEMLYYLDVKKIVRDKLRLVPVILIILAITGIYKFDLFHYNTYLPKQDQVKNINIELPLSYLYMDPSNESEIAMGNSDEMFEAAQILSANALTEKESNQLNHAAVSYIYSVNVEYEMNDGQSIYRTYDVNWNDVKWDLAMINDNSQYLDYQYRERTNDMETVEAIHLEYLGEDGAVQLFTAKDEERIEFMKTLQQDAQKLNRKIITEEIPVGVIRYEIKKTRTNSRREQVVAEIEDYYDYSMESAYIYPSYKDTLKLLKEMGYELSSTIDATKVGALTVCHDEEDAEDVDRIKCDTQEEIDVIVPALIPVEFLNDWMDVENSIYVNVSYKGKIEEDGNTCYLLKDGVSESLKERFAIDS